jgi:hydroxypyruvate isomerase
VTHSLRYLANCSIMFTELPLLQRPAAGREAGFEAVEFWWPFDRPVPGDAAVDAFVAAIADAGGALVALNFFAGDPAGPDRGVLSIPDRSPQFTDNVEVTVGIGARLGARGFNALHGNRVAGLPSGQQDELATANIAAHASAIAHVQIADAPGRGEPGSGRLDLDGYLSRLEQAGYDGWVALEYQPTASTLDSLGWLPRARRGGQPGPHPPG